MRPGRPLWQVSQAIQRCAEAEGFHVVRDFVGHGIGRRMHEPPSVTNFVSRRSEAGRLTMRPGLVIAPEPMVNVGTGDVRLKPDGWTVISKDHSLSAHFENTIAVTEDGPRVLTAL
jgi:methionyl aminopeptidase